MRVGPDGLLCHHLCKHQYSQRPERMFVRYAIFYTPPPGHFADFGAAWLGWDGARGIVAEHPDIAGFDVATITETPRKYGLHGTIKPPFRLAPGTTAQELQSAVESLCKSLPPIQLEGVELAVLGRFLALCPVGDTGPLNTCAARVVKELDRFRAPLTDDELAQRRSGNLTSVQDENLKQWGYPHVMNAFRFHITLTGKLNKRLASELKTTLDPILESILPRPFVINSLTLVGQRTDGMFVEVKRYPLSGP